MTRVSIDKNSTPHQSRLGNSSNFMKYRDKFRFSMAGHALRGNLESVDYKEDELSNHVLRSFITSSVRLSIKEDVSVTSSCFFVLSVRKVSLYLYIFFLFKAFQYFLAFCICSDNVVAKLCVPEKSSLAHIYM